MRTFQDIVVATDYEPAAQRAADLACELAIQFEARLTLMHVWELVIPTYSERLALPLDAIERAANEAMMAELDRVRPTFPAVQSLVVSGVAWRTVGDCVRAHGFDLVIVGTHGRRGLQRMVMGSVAERIVRTSSVPVLTVH